jgi:hypothetical protein
MALFLQLLVWLLIQASHSLPDISNRRDLQSHPWELDLPSLPGTCEDATKTFNALFFEATEKCQEVISIITPPTICKQNSGECPPGLNVDCQDFDVFQETCGVSMEACLRNYRDELNSALSAAITIYDFIATGGAASWAGWFASKAVTALSVGALANDVTQMLIYGEAMAEFKMGFRRLFKEHPDLLMEIVQYQFDHREPGRFVAPWDEVDRHTQEVIFATACKREAERALRLVDQETLIRQMKHNPMLPHNREETLQSIEDAREAGEIADDVLEAVGSFLETMPERTENMGFVEVISGELLGLVGEGASALAEAESGEFIGKTYAQVTQYIDGEWTKNQASCFDAFTNNNHEFNNQMMDCGGWGFFGLSFLDPTGLSSLAYTFVDADQCPNFPSDPRYNPRSTLSSEHPWHLIKEDAARRINLDISSIPLFESFFADSRGDGESLLHQVKNKLLSQACPNDSTKFSKGVCRPMSQTMETTEDEEAFVWAMLQDTRSQIAFSPQIETDQCCDKEGSQLVDNFAECFDAFVNLQIPYTTWGGKISDPSRPGGCILDVKTDVVRFNTNFEQKDVKGLDEPLCKRGENTFAKEFTPIAEIDGFVVGARGQACPDQQSIVIEADCEYAVRMFTENRPDPATVEMSLEDNIQYQIGCSLNLGQVGIYNDFHMFADNSDQSFKSDPNSYPVCYKEGVILAAAITPEHTWWKGECHYWQKSFDHGDCPNGFKINRLDRCGWLDIGSKPVCVKTEMICSEGTYWKGRTVNGADASGCIAQTYFGESNTWRPSPPQSQIPCDGFSCAAMSLLDVTYVKQDDGEHCSNGRITDETSCRMAAAYIGETYARTWHGSTDTPGCIFANDGRNVVYFNTALDANGYNARYAEICLISRGFTFRLRGRSGSEQVTIRVDGTAPQTMTLSTQWTEFHSPTRSFTVSFNNDGSNRDVYFAADFEAQIRTDAFWQEWNCESGNGNWRCDRVRNGEFLWTSDYTITLGNRRKL